MSGAAGAAATVRGVSGPVSGRGFTRTKVYVGINSWQDVGEATKLLGGDAIQTGDQQAYARAVIAEINKAGGIAGRQVEPVFYDLKTSEAANAATVTEEACTLWTEDRPVFAVLYVSGAGLLDDDIATCLSKVGVAVVYLNSLGMPAWFDKLPLVWAPMSPRYARHLPAVVGRADAQGYFRSWDTAQGASGSAPAKVGIVTTAWSSSTEALRGFTQGVEAAGYKVVATAQVSGPTDGSGANSAVLKFRQEGVTHVMNEGQCIGGIVPFMSTADSQRYYPRYLIHTGNCPQLLVRFTPRSQWRGAIGAGYQPALDVDWAHDPGDPSPGRTRCQKTMRDAGEAPRTSRDGFAFMVWFCDGFQFLTTAIRGGGDVLTPQAFIRGAQAIRRMEPSSTFAISFPQRRDGAAGLRDLVFRDDCQCPVYVSGNKPF